MKRLIFVNRYFFPDHSATSQLLSDLAFDLARSGAEVLVITGRQRYDNPRARLARYECIAGVTVRRVWTTRFGRQLLAGRALDYLSFYLSAAAALWREARRGDTVVAKTDPPLIGVVAALAARRRGAVLVNWIQDLFPEVAATLGVKALGGAAARPLTALRDWALREAACNVVLGDLMAARIAAAGVPHRRIRIIHNWIGDDVRPIPHDRNPLRRDWGLEDKFVVVYSGNLGRAHEFGTILAAADLLRQRRDIVFLFIGGGAQSDELRRQVESRALPNVAFKSYQPRERLAESLSVGDAHLACLLPALEGLIVPSKVYGILAVARPVVYLGTPKGEIPRLLCREGCGVTIGIGEGAALAAQLNQWADDPGTVQRLGMAGRRLFLARFRKETAIENWREVLGLSNYLQKEKYEKESTSPEVFQTPC